MGVRLTAETRIPLGLVPLVAALALVLGPAPAAAQSPAPAPPVTVDGPSSDIVGLGALSIARDGSGGLVYLKQVMGVQHVFVSRLAGGAFQPPDQVDAALGGPSSEPVIAAGNGGVLLVGLINGQNLYVIDRASAASGYAAPLELFAGAAHPSLQMTNFGKAYLAFTADDGTGSHDVRSAYYHTGAWALESSPLDAVPADDAGSGTGRPQVAAAGDGVAIVAWGEAGHIYSRRVWGTSPSIVHEQADAPLPGCAEISVAEPGVAAGGDSSYTDVVFHARLSCGGVAQSRVLMRRLRASQYEDVMAADGLSAPAAEGADQPRIAMAEYGTGFITSARTGSNQLFTAVLNGNGHSAGVMRVDSLQNVTQPYAIPATAGLAADLIAWQQNPGSMGAPEIRVRYSQDGSTFDPELVLSSPELGPTDASRGLGAAGDGKGDAAAAWVQGAGSSTRIVAGQLYEAPGSFAPLRAFAYTRTKQPVLAWSPSRERWGPLRYLVSLDGNQIAQTTGTSVRVPSALADGPHGWQVTAVNVAGETRTTRRATVWVDTVAPVARLALTGTRRAGFTLHLRVSYSDSPAPALAANASGVATVAVRWGDGTAAHIHHSKFHVYGQPGRYKLTVTVKDRAGNATSLVRYVRVGRHNRSRRPHARAPVRRTRA